MSTRVLSLCSWSSLLPWWSSSFFFFFFFLTKWKTISLCQILADWMMSTASVWFPPSDCFFFACFFKWPVNYKLLFVPFLVFCLFFSFFSKIRLHPAEHCWTSNAILDWCFVTLDQVTYGPRVETSLPTKDDWNLWDANKLCLHARSADTPVNPHTHTDWTRLTTLNHWPVWIICCFPMLNRNDLHARSSNRHLIDRNPIKKSQRSSKIHALWKSK